MIGAIPEPRRFHAVVNELESIAEQILKGRDTAIPHWASERDLHQAFRKSTKLNVRQRLGAFFTGDRLSRQVLRHAPPTGTVCDIACGTGSLLLRHADRLRVAATLDETLDRWGEHLVGREVQESLLRVARARIIITAAQRLRKKHRKVLKASRRYDALLPELKTENGLRSGDALAKATDIVLNPPFTPMIAPRGCVWAEGSINSAAWFLAYCLDHARPGTRVTAILPDVLRSGERYSRWRACVEARASVEAVESVGRFDQHADVDVFVLRLSVKKGDDASGSARRARWAAEPAGLTLGDFFAVTVGALVAYRTPATGPWRPYLDVSNAEAWGAVHDVKRNRRFTGRLQTPPFVAVRRTSSPGDQNRAIPTLVTGERPVAVENHLLVLHPLDRSIKSCEEAVQVLSKARTNEWLNARIRCRHLTVESVREIPWDAPSD